MPQPPKAWIFQRNARYLDSVRIALVVGLWWFPTALLRNLKPSVVDLVVALLSVLLGAPLVIICHLAFIAAGLLGFLAEVETDAQPTESREKAR